MVKVLGARSRARTLACILSYAALVLVIAIASSCNCGPSLPLLGEQLPNGPDGVRLTGNSASQSVLVEWNAVPGAESYQIYWMDSPGGEAVLLGTTSDLFFTHSGVSSGVGYYMVAASNPNGLSGKSAPMPVTITPDTPDPVPPVVISNTPATGAIGVPVDTAIVVGFSEPVASATVTSTTFVVTGPAGPVPGELLITGPSVTFIPSLPLIPGSGYTVTITTAVTDLTGDPLQHPFTWTFITADPGVVDTTAPLVVSNTPLDGATQVNINTTVGVGFSEPMDPATVTELSFTLRLGPSFVPGTVTAGTAAAVFTPSSPLQPGTIYTATVGTRCTDLAGNRLVSSHVWSFTTAGGNVVIIDTTPPVVTSNTPASGTTNVNVNTSISVSFSEEMNPATLTTSSFVVQSGGVGVSGIVNTSGSTAVFTPGSPLQPGTTYNVTITTAATDLAGNPLQSIHVFSFTTATPDVTDTTAPQVVANTPGHGAANVPVGTAVSVSFSEPMAPATVNTASFKLSTGGSLVNGTVDYNGIIAVFIPSSPLLYSTTYTATVTTAATDLAGNPLVASHTWSFTTGEPGVVMDTTAPQVVANTPGHGAENVPVGATVSVSFSEPMSPATVNTASFTLSTGGSLVSGTVNYNGIIAAFTPSSPLLYSTTYTATVTTAATDLAGNPLIAGHVWSFTTGEPGVVTDTTAPQVVANTPGHGAANVPVGTAVSVSFSEPMAPATVNTTSFTLSTGGSLVNGTVSYTGIIAVFTPSSPLLHSTTYTATVTTAATDLAGNPLVAGHVWSFTTAVPDVVVDTTAPQVILGTPANGSVDVAVNSLVEVVFSEAMLASSINSASFILRKGGVGVSGTVTPGGTSAVFTPSSPLLYSTTYTAKVTTAATDLAGNPLVASYTWSFTTAAPPVDLTPLVITEKVPAPNATNVPTNSVIKITFNKELDPATLNSTTFKVKKLGITIPGTITVSGNVATFTPQGGMKKNYTYTVYVTTGVKDVYGVALSEASTHSFKTKK